MNNNTQLTIEEIDLLDYDSFDDLLSDKNREDLEFIGISLNHFIREFKDAAVLSGLEDDKTFMSINDFIAHLREEKEINEKEIKNMGNNIEEMEKENNESLTVVNENNITNISAGIINTSANKPEIITNITDKKLIFNLGKGVDKLLNDCEGEEITISKVLIKKYQKPLEHPIVSAETGEIISDTKTSMSVVIVDDKGVSYATGSKTFGYSLLNCIYDFGNEIEGLKIKIIKVLRNGCANKSLDFEIL